LGRIARVATVLVAVYHAVSLLGSRVAVAGSRSDFPVPPDRIGTSWRDVAFDSRDDHVGLSGWLFTPAVPSGRSVILVHGWQGEREDVDFVPLSRDLLRRGYAVLLFDLRGSGRSGGAYQTFAHDETRDVLGAYDFMRQRGYRANLMTVLGNSMGAATVLEAAPELQDVAALVSDSAFTDLSGAMMSGLTHFTGLPGTLALPALQFARLWDVVPSLSPAEVVASLPGRAFLFFHAQGDRLLPVSNARSLRSASSNPHSRLVVLGGTDHLDTYNHDRASYLSALLSFIDEEIAARGGAAG
jgi:pimeloyl-ACP methyl ester carboxylesterase